MTDIQTHLNNNHFYPSKIEKKNGQLSALFIDCPPILKDSKTNTVKEILKDFNVTVQYGHSKTESYITVKMKSK